MAASPQHPGQIMETQTRYDLNAAVAGWQQELAEQAHLTDEIRRELETHLDDAIAGYRQRGLSDEESFWLARRRVGQPELLAAEFKKDNITSVWRERIFWMAVAFLAFDLWMKVVSSIQNRIFGGFQGLYSYRLGGMLPEWVQFYLPNWLRGILGEPALFPTLLHLLDWTPVVFMAVALAKGRLQRGHLLGNVIFQSRLHFVITGLVLLAMVAVSRWVSVGQNFHNASSMLIDMTSFLPWNLSLIALIAWLMPVSNQRHLKNA